MAMIQSPTLTVAATDTLDTAAVLASLKRQGVTHLVWLPDSESAVLYDLVRRDTDVTLVQVCREGESFGVAAGLFVAGKKPVVVIQSTGFYESARLGSRAGALASPAALAPDRLPRLSARRTIGG